ncbi:unnamed protein product [Clonostachys rhizophaga]|uniref:Major facilitator superfamily (MFS) profile domain-containing protein n=1 Tax=Clonostachys rhizophaga TaxID=160324 RepID=A0A9N9VEM6_9HYPO|nr:unnamed protein product [Clonostachys rhizophaga]
MENQLSFWEKMKFYSVIGVGFFADGWANSNIGLITPMVGYIFFQDTKNAIPLSQSGAIKATGKIGMLVGQLAFGFLGDTLGRHKVYGRELFFTMFGILMCTLLPWKGLSHNAIVVWLSVGRFITGIGLGGDYPMSASLALEKADSNARAKVVMSTFFLSAIGNVSASITFVILLAVFKGSIENNIHSLEWVWRLLMGLPLLPCFLTIYSRLTMKETRPYEEYVRHASSESATEKPRSIREQFHDFRLYFSQYRHAMALFSACAGWFLFDICSDGVGLNQSIVLAGIGFGKGATPYSTLWNTAVGNIIVQGAGYVPGFIFGIFLIGWIGRRTQQSCGAALIAILYAIWAGVTGTTSIGALMALFTLTQFFQLCGPNITTFLLPVELFPTRVRGTGHGLVAASGKAGAILTAFAFGNVEKAIGMKGVLGLFAGLQVVITLLTAMIPETRGYSLEDIENDIPYKTKLLNGRPLQGESAEGKTYLIWLLD